ncbi:serine/threonine-protein kinase [Planctomycetes bacterium K23_9]|uniref:non-specific serine/threonine protein kinase n=1 Tax=Stieleria marina TaxID=1930275 RepID=A0A517NP91_9BACT|nr:Serine/threonine-protein kinase PknB [Planctomycetes bacterium K23_9]
MNEREIFTIALEKATQTARREYLDQVCGDDHALRQRVEDLLRAASEVGEFLENDPPGLVLTVCSDSPRVFGESLSDLSLDFLTPSNKPGCLGTLGQYEVVGLVGRGGCGLVFRAYDTRLNRIVAIKVMAPELATNPTAVKRFLREAQAAAAVRHEHVVTIHAIEETSHPPLIVMEYVDGVSLKDRVDSDGELELSEILRIGKQIALGLVAAHEQGLVHRDIKPANILLESGVNRVQITDFGLARATDDIGMTQTGMIAGTPQYMSPEQSLGNAIDSRSDLFSLGSVLYTLCTGRPAFRADSTVATLRRVCDDVPRSIRSVNPAIPEWMEQIVMRLMAKSPDDRFQSASEVAELLNDCIVNDRGTNAKFDFPETNSVPFFSRVSTNVSTFRDSWFVPLVALQILGMVVALPMALINIESIVVTGIVFGLVVGTAVTLSAWMSGLRWTSIAFGASSIVFTLLLAFIIKLFSLRPSDVGPIVTLITLFVFAAVPWGVVEIRRFWANQRVGTRRQLSVFRPQSFLAIYALQLIAIGAACVAATLEVESVIASALLAGLLIGSVLSVFALKTGQHVESQIFALSAPVFTVFLSFVVSLFDWNTLHHYLPDAVWIATAIFVYGAIVIPIGLIGFAKELDLWSSKQKPYRFQIRTGLIATAIIAVAFAGAQPCLAFGGLCYAAGVLFALALVSIAAMVGYRIYLSDQPKRIPRLATLGTAALVLQVGLMGLVAAYDRTTDYGFVRIRTDVPVKLVGVHVPSQRSFFSNTLDDGSVFMNVMSGEVRLSVRDRPDLTVVPSTGVLSRNKPLEVRIVPVEP